MLYAEKSPGQIQKQKKNIEVRFDEQYAAPHVLASNRRVGWVKAAKTKAWESAVTLTLNVPIW